MKNLSQHINESFDSENILEYFSYRISNFQELSDGLKEINAPIEITTNGKNVIVVDSKKFKVSDKIKNDTFASIKFDDQLYAALRENQELSKMWKQAEFKYSAILKNVQSKARELSSISTTNWGSTGPAEINKYFQNITNVQSFLKDLLANKDSQDSLREYEVLRHLYDRGYAQFVK